MAGVQPNFLLIAVILMGVQWVNPLYYVLVALFGLSQDSFSHGLLGVYGISFVLTGVLANLMGRLVYEPVTQVPEFVYGSDIGSHYQRQGLKLSKHFRLP